ncbi:MAG TPA: ComEC/Rec2 family competence protein [Candidatus Paceibacterota bacterium]|nr:ComEC/Rec2 family competence protein [Candidatus Paceibacterota bacterium]
MSDRIVLAGLTGFAGGILCRSLFFFSWQVLALLVLCIGVLSVAGSLRRSLYYALAIAFLVGAVAGVARVMLVPASASPEIVVHVGEEVSLVGRVATEPDVRELTQRVRLRVGSGDTVLVVAPLYPALRIGDAITARGTLEYPEPFATDGGRTFRYDRYLAKDGIHLIMERAVIERMKAMPTALEQLHLRLLSIKHGFQSGLGNALPEPYASLASGLITGGKQGLGARLLDAFIVSGLVHIVVLSGYNVMIVAEAVLRMLGFLSRRVAAVAAGVAIALFVLVAGAGAASIRAGLMASLALTARATGRTYAVSRALLAAGALMLLANPLLLAFDPGFQLSFVATLGLILGAPRLARILGFIRSGFWRELCAATLAAQLAVLPLLLYQTGLFSFVSIPANLLVLPVIPLAMLLGAFAGVLGFIVPALAPVFGLPALMLLSYIVSVAETMAMLPLSSVTVPQFPFVFVVLAYAVLGYLVAKTPAVPSGTAGAFTQRG